MLPGACGFASASGWDQAVLLARGAGLARQHCRSLAQWCALLGNAGSTVETCNR